MKKTKYLAFLCAVICLITALSVSASAAGSVTDQMPRTAPHGISQRQPATRRPVRPSMRPMSHWPIPQQAEGAQQATIAQAALGTLPLLPEAPSALPAQATAKAAVSLIPQPLPAEVFPAPLTVPIPTAPSAHTRTQAEQTPAFRRPTITMLKKCQAPVLTATKLLFQPRQAKPQWQRHFSA